MPIEHFFKDTCSIYNRAAATTPDNFGRPTYTNQLVITLKCLFDPYVVRSLEDVGNTSISRQNEVTFYTEYPSNPSAIKSEMYVVYESETYRIKYINRMKALGTRGSHLEICTERATNL